MENSLLDNLDQNLCFQESLILEDFKEYHKKLVGDTLQYGTPVYTIATLSATESVAWLETLVSFVDNFMKDLTEKRFITDPFIQF